LKPNQLKKKRLLIKKLIDTNINIAPSALQTLLKFEAPLEKLDLIIRETSFIPTFDNILTLDTLQSISNKEIQKILKRLNFGNVIKQKTQGSNKEDISLKEKSNKPERSSSKNLKNYAKPSKNNIKEMDSNSESSEIKNSEIKGSNVKSSETINSRVEEKSMEIQHQKIKAETKTINAETKTINAETQIKKLKSSESSVKDKDKKKIKEKIKKMSPSRSSLKFKSIAKDYDFDYNIKMDPTKNLYNAGEYDDFYNTTLDKFNKLKKLMKKRPETHSSTNIINIKKLSNKSEVSIIGMVKNLRRTKNNHYFFQLEDTTGTVNVLVRNDSEDQNTLRTINKTINDQMLFVRGTYSFDKSGRDGIIFADDLSKIDIPMELVPNTAPEPLSIALISDTHIGSREFEEPLWNRFIDFLNGKLGNKKQRERASKIKYIIINGDLIDGIGVYPNQQEDLTITDIYKQYKKGADLLSGIPDYIKVFYSSGNHDPVRNAIPRPAVSKKYCKDLLDLEVEIIGNPCMIETHSVNSLVYHGDSLLDLNLSIPELNNDNPADTMKELLICRHLAPSFGDKTQIAPCEKDWLVIEEIPQIFHTGHLHINGFGIYRGVRLVNSGCFQSQTAFMKSFGINPTPGQVPIIELDTLDHFQINLRN
jgi:DNA polymerase II small subunit